jgi:FAD/FMN-containing dehydrogenase
MSDPPGFQGAVTGEAVNELRRSLSGDVLVAGDREYERARLCFNLLIDRRPAAIARCVDAADVATALEFARSNELEVAVRGGGHNPAGHCAVDDGLVIDLSRMRQVVVDRDARTARSGGGATWLDFDAATQAHGLVTPGGVVGSTGVAGLTFGGGIGHLTAQHGLTCDNLTAATLVTPAGEVVRTDDADHDDLLWALRGGGGNFGIATELEFELHPLARVVGGRLEYAGERVGDVLRRYRDAVAHAGRELSIEAQLATDMDVIPTVTVAPCFTGAGEPDELRKLRSAPGLVDDGVRLHGFLDQQRVFDPGYGVDRDYWKGHFVRELTDELIDVLVGVMGALGRPPGAILFESLHGAAKDVDPDTAALGYRDAAFNVSVMASWTDPSHDDEQIAWARETAAAIEPWSISGGYANYMQADEPLERVRAAFGPASFDRLRALKSRYDRDNILHRNQNIPPRTPISPG